MTVINDKDNSKKGKRHYFSNKQVVATAATVVSAQGPKTYTTMAHLRKKWISFKDDFHSDKPITVAKVSPNKISSWKIWRKRKGLINGPEPSSIPQQQQQQYQAFFNFNIPIVISSTHNYYKQDYSEKEENQKQQQQQQQQQQQHFKEPTHSIIRQLTIIPSFNANLLLTVILVALLVIAFGILQIHRTISILNTGIDFIKYTLITSLSVSKSLTLTILSLFR